MTTTITNKREQWMIKDLVSKDDIVLDIGACIGEYTTLLAQQAKHVYAFEPSPKNFEQLQINTKDYATNITLFEAAVSDKNGFETLYMCPTDIGMNRLYYSPHCVGGDRHTVQTITIDHFVSNVCNLTLANEEEKVKFIKIDIEGYEYHALKGMRQLLERDKPAIMMEFHIPSLIEAGTTHPEDIFHMLKDELGYNDPIHCFNGGTIPSYSKLYESDRFTPALNILWVHN